MRLLLVASELPTATRGGSLCLHRLLAELPGCETHVLTHETQRFPWTWPVHHARRGGWFYKYWHSRFGTRLQQASLTRGLELPAGKARYITRQIRPDLILTVGYGPAFVSARRLARETEIPLASLFMDWWPDLACNHLEAPASLHTHLEREFRALHAASAVSFPFSAALASELGRRPQDVVLPPVSGEPWTNDIRPAVAMNRLAYAGLATGLYAETFRGILRAARAFPALRLDYMGPGLPADVRQDAPAGFQDHGFLSGAELEQKLGAAGALLVTLPFAIADRRLARTSFSSKFTHYCRYGRPIIIWAPDDAAIVSFAREHRAALPVTCDDPAAVWQAFQRLTADGSLQAELAANAHRVFETHFSAPVVRARFHAGLNQACRR